MIAAEVQKLQWSSRWKTHLWPMGDRVQNFSNMSVAKYSELLAENTRQ